MTVRNFSNQKTISDNDKDIIKENQFSADSRKNSFKRFRTIPKSDSDFGFVKM